MVPHPLDLWLFVVVLICLFVGRMIAWEVAPALEAQYGLAPRRIAPTITGMTIILGIILFGICVYSHDKFQEWQRRRRAKLARRWAATGRPDNLRGANLWGADLSGVDLGASEEGGKGANLAGANLKGSNLTGTNLSSANLRDADLSAVNLRSANLRDADLRDTDLQWASLVGADLRGAKLEVCSLEHTKYDNATRWPEGFTPPPEAVNVDAEGNAH